MSSAADKPRRGIQSVELGSQLLVALGRHVAPMALRDLAKAAGMTAGKAHPYLVSFIKVGFVSQDTAGRYELGPLALQLGMAKLRRLDPGTYERRARPGCAPPPPHRPGSAARRLAATWPDASQPSAPPAWSRREWSCPQ